MARSSGLSAYMPRIRYRKGLKVDASHWEVVRDTNPSKVIPKSPRFAFSTEPFLIIVDRFSRRSMRAGIQRTGEGRKVWWLEWLCDGEEQMHMCPESLQELLFYLDDSLFEARRIASRHPRRK